MAIADNFLPEFDHEMGVTRRVLEGVPDAKRDFRPHPKSWTMGGLATHIANLPNWAKTTFEADSFDMAPKDGPAPRAPEAHSTAEIVERFDRNVAAARATLAAVSDERMMGPWKLLEGGNELFTMPRAAVFRNFVMNHIIHHRAQLSLYYRLAGLDPPFIYGPPAK